MTRKEVDALYEKHRFIFDMRHFWFVGPFLIWTSVRFPYVGIRRRRA